jgi:hypothetical protein
VGAVGCLEFACIDQSVAEDFKERVFREATIGIRESLNFLKKIVVELLELFAHSNLPLRASSITSGELKNDAHSARSTVYRTRLIPTGIVEGVRRGKPVVTR